MDTSHGIVDKNRQGFGSTKIGPQPRRLLFIADRLSFEYRKKIGISIPIAAQVRLPLYSLQSKTTIFQDSAGRLISGKDWSVDSH